MKALSKLVLGIFSLVPVVFFVAFFGLLLPSFFRAHASGQRSIFATRFDALVPFAVSTSILLLVLLLVYTVLLVRRSDLHIAEKIGVPLGILFTNGIVLPAIWWLYVWRESSVRGLFKSAR